MASGAGSCPTKDLVSRNGAIHEAVQRGRLADVEEVVRKDWAAVNEPGAQQVRSPPPKPGVGPGSCVSLLLKVSGGHKRDGGPCLLPAACLMQRTPLMLAARWGKVELIEVSRPANTQTGRLAPFARPACWC